MNRAMARRTCERETQREPESLEIHRGVGDKCNGWCARLTGVGPRP